jgi:hypothetical protein
MSEVNTVAANQLVVLGGGIIFDDYCRPMLHDRSIERADRAIGYYYSEPARFLAHGAMIVCSGGFSNGLCAEYIPTPYREANLMAGLLMQAEVPSSLIETETESSSTAQNLLNCIDLGYINPNNIDPDNPLGVVSHRHHLDRFILLASKVGIHPEAVQKIPAEQEDVASKEFLKRLFYRTILVGVKDPVRLKSRTESAENSLGKTKTLVRNFTGLI